MAIKIAIANQKGGIGKTTTALALAADLIRKGYKVLVVDTDPQRNTTKVYKAETNGVATLYDIVFSRYGAKECIQRTEYGDIIASDEQLQDADTAIKPGPNMYNYIKNALKNIEKEYDYILFDTPPHIGILLGNVLMATEHVIIPISADLFGIQGVLDFYSTVQEYKEVNTNLNVLGLLIIKYKGRQNLTKDIEDNLLPQYAAAMHTQVFENKIRESVKCQEAQTLQQSLFTYAPNCTTATDYANLTAEILKLLNGGNK